MWAICGVGTFFLIWYVIARSRKRYVYSDAIVAAIGGVLWPLGVTFVVIICLAVYISAWVHEDDDSE